MVFESDHMLSRLQLLPAEIIPCLESSTNTASAGPAERQLGLQIYISKSQSFGARILIHWKTLIATWIQSDATSHPCGGNARTDGAGPLIEMDKRRVPLHT